MAVRDLKVLKRHYDAILDGQKTIEARAPELDGEFKYKGVEEDDILKFYYNEDKNPSACFEVEDVTYYCSINALLEEGWEEIDPEAEDGDEFIEEVRNLPGNYDKRIEKHGIYAIKIGDKKESYS